MRALAEEEGFEPPVSGAYACFQDRCLKPLSHSSECKSAMPGTLHGFARFSSIFTRLLRVRV